MPIWISAAWSSLIAIVVRAEDLVVFSRVRRPMGFERDRVAAPGPDGRVEGVVVLAGLYHDRHRQGVAEDHGLFARFEGGQDRPEAAGAADAAEDRLDVAVVVELAGDAGAGLGQYLV